ncbi:MAG: hypothetical protein AAGI92_01950 [Pseudomonadota bacterium]
MRETPGSLLTEGLAAAHNERRILFPEKQIMPSLLRLIFTLGVLAGLAYAAMFALVIYVEPREREVSVILPRGQLQLEQIIDQPRPTPQPITEQDAEQAEN